MFMDLSKLDYYGISKHSSNPAYVDANVEVDADPFAKTPFHGQVQSQLSDTQLSDFVFGVNRALI